MGTSVLKLKGHTMIGEHFVRETWIVTLNYWRWGLPPRVGHSLMCPTLVLISTLSKRAGCDAVLPWI